MLNEEKYEVPLWIESLKFHGLFKDTGISFCNTGHTTEAESNVGYSDRIQLEILVQQSWEY
jgi:hypothetical protein